MATDPATEAGRVLAEADRNAWSPGDKEIALKHWTRVANEVLSVAAPLIRRQAFNEAAEAVEAHRPTLERFDVGYRAGLELALRAVRGLGDGEKENHG